jgi:hypothetical protein
VSLSQETQALVAKGLGWDDLFAGSGNFGRIIELEGGGSDFISTADLAAACKAKLRERGGIYQNGLPYFTYSSGFCMGSCDAQISTHDDAGRLAVFRGRATDDDLAVIEAFAQAVKAGAL